MQYTTNVATADISYVISNNSTCPSSAVTISADTKIKLIGSTADYTGQGGTLSYRWQERELSGLSWSDAVGTNTDLNYITPVLANETHQYRRIVTVTGGGTVVSRDTSTAIAIIADNLRASNATFTANGVNFNMIAALGGTASIGSYTPIPDNVYIGTFSIGETEVTQGLFNAVMSYSGLGTGSQSGITLSAITKPGFQPGEDRHGTGATNIFVTAGDNYPMMYVTWFDAIVFCNRLSIILGKTPVYRISGNTNPSLWGATPSSTNADWDAVVIDYSAAGFRLPTEAEWEYAARGGQQTHGYAYSGSDIASEVAWGSSSPGGARIHEVKGLAPNELGLYDMSGNIWEWCSDWYGDTYPASCVNPVVGNPPNDSGRRVARGGNYGGGWDRVDYRDYGGDPYFRNGFYYGFRVVLGL